MENRKNSKRKHRHEHNKSSTQQQTKPRAKTTINSGICIDVSKRFEKIGRVGEGTYGVVYKARDKNNNGELVALKRCIPHHESSDGFPLTTLREISALRLCSHHPNIVDLLTVAVSGSGGVFLVMPLIGSLDVAQILDEPKYHPKPFSESQVKTMLRQLLSALEFCHSHSVIHRDIKPSNMLYSFDGVLKLADFGLSRHIFPDQRYLTANVVSLWYRAPELLMKRNNNSYSFGIDLWALGCVFAELLQGVPLLPGKDESNQIFRLNSCLGPPPSALFPDGVRINPSDSTDDLWDRFANLSIEGLTLLTKLLEYDNIERWTANQALESKYFKVEPLPANLMPKFS